jgi:hypothetical protein
VVKEEEEKTEKVMRLKKNKRSEMKKNKRSEMIGIEFSKSITAKILSKEQIDSL